MWLVEYKTIDGISLNFWSLNSGATLNPTFGHARF